jgi:hypothetical protein
MENSEKNASAEAVERNALRTQLAQERKAREKEIEGLKEELRLVKEAGEPPSHRTSRPPLSVAHTLLQRRPSTTSSSLSRCPSSSRKAVPALPADRSSFHVSFSGNNGRQSTQSVCSLASTDSFAFIGTSSALNSFPIPPPTLPLRSPTHSFSPPTQSYPTESKSFDTQQAWPRKHVKGSSSLFVGVDLQSRQPSFYRSNSDHDTPVILPSSEFTFSSFPSYVDRISDGFRSDNTSQGRTHARIASLM